MVNYSSRSILPFALPCIAGAGPALADIQTHAKDGCDPNYVNACAPIAPDVDCAGGSVNQ